MLDNAYTPDGCLDGKSRKRQSAIDMVRLVSSLEELLSELSVLSDDDHIEVANVRNEFLASLPKTDREELRHG